MLNSGFSLRRYLGRFLAFGGRLVVLALIGFFVGSLNMTVDDLDKQPNDPELRIAQAANDNHGSPVWSLVFSRDDTLLASATVAGDIFVQDITNRRSKMIRRGRPISAQALAFSPDGETLAVAGAGTVVRLLDARSGEQLDVFAVDGTKHVKDVAFSHDGRYLAAGGFGGSISLWDRDAHRVLELLDGRRASINSIAFSPDDSTIAAGDSEGMVKLWDVLSGTIRITFRAYDPGAGATVVKFSPDGAFLATASYPGGATRLWSSTSGNLQLTIPNPTSSVRALAFCRDGTLLALARVDGIAALWGVTEARELGWVQANQLSLQSVTLSGDGRRLATGGADGHVRLWDVDQALKRGALRNADSTDRRVAMVNNPDLRNPGFAPTLSVSR